NSLNAIMALVRDRETTQAVRALSLLSDVPRAAVNAGDTQETTLAQELDFVTRYLEIERVRLGDNFRWAPFGTVTIRTDYVDWTVQPSRMYWPMQEKVSFNGERLR